MATKQKSTPKKLSGNWSKRKRTGTIKKMLMLLEAKVDGWIDENTGVDEKGKSTLNPNPEIDLAELNKTATTFLKLQEALAIEEQGWHKLNAPKGHLPQKATKQADVNIEKMAVVVNLGEQGATKTELLERFVNGIPEEDDEQPGDQTTSDSDES